MMIFPLYFLYDDIHLFMYVMSVFPKMIYYFILWLTSSFCQFQKALGKWIMNFRVTTPRRKKKQSPSVYYVVVHKLGVFVGGTKL